MPQLDAVNTPNHAERPKRDNRGDFQIKPLRYTVRDVSTLLRCTKPFIFKLIKNGALKAVGSRRKVWITASSLEEYLANLPDWRP